jgi:hypothetical protein
MMDGVFAAFASLTQQSETMLSELLDARRRVEAFKAKMKRREQEAAFQKLRIAKLMYEISLLTRGSPGGGR